MHRPTLATLAALVVLGLVTAGAAATSASSTAPAADRNAPVRRHHPAPSHFTHGRVDNRWFPLKAGNRYAYRGTEDRAPAPRRLDRDVPDQGGRRRDLPRGVRPGVASTGSSTSAPTTSTPRPGAAPCGTSARTPRPSIVTATSSAARARSCRAATARRPGSSCTRIPHPGPSFHQEDFPGHAEDVFTVVRRGAHVVVPLINTRHALLTRETTVLEPGVVDHKYYVRDIGTVRELTVKGGTESLRLVSLTHLPRR